MEFDDGGAGVVKTEEEEEDDDGDCEKCVELRTRLAELGDGAGEAIGERDRLRRLVERLQQDADGRERLERKLSQEQQQRAEDAEDAPAALAERLQSLQIKHEGLMARMQEEVDRAKTPTPSPLGLITPRTTPERKRTTTGEIAFLAPAPRLLRPALGPARQQRRSSSSEKKKKEQQSRRRLQLQRSSASACGANIGPKVDPARPRQKDTGPVAPCGYRHDNCCNSLGILVIHRTHSRCDRLDQSGSTNWMDVLKSGWGGSEADRSSPKTLLVSICFVPAFFFFLADRFHHAVIHFCPFTYIQFLSFSLPSRSHHACMHPSSNHLRARQNNQPPFLPF